VVPRSNRKIAVTPTNILFNRNIFVGVKKRGTLLQDSLSWFVSEAK